ncbi:MAG: ABC transporter ATP-binding protein [Acidimicrobiales bacterium]
MLLTVDDLSIEFGSRETPLVAVHGVDFAIDRGEVLGLVGESGSGKSLTSRAITKLITPAARVSSGVVTFDGRDVLTMSHKALRAFRASDVGMIFQDPFSSLNPVFRVGAQISETLRLNKGLDKHAARQTAIDMLERVGIPNPAQNYLSYPHELSGGMRQRIMIALATAAGPKLLVADEPTTALDVLTQKEILQLLSEMRRDLGMAILLVSHDFGVIAQMCDRVLVMYGGRIVESGPVDEIYYRPRHPYTKGLLASVPELESANLNRRRIPLLGQPPELGPLEPGCVFMARCPHARPACASVSMILEPVGAAHTSACPFEGGHDEDVDALAGAEDR